MATIKYHNAYDENGILVDINDVVKEERHLHTYKCIVCGETLLPRMGEERAWHFWHEKNTKCNGETYIHKLAKIRLKEKFDNSKHYNISYRGKNICGKENCCLRNHSCEENGYITKDLKEIYDTATIERDYKGFTSDILLSDSRNPSQEPIFIEIFVKHKCEQEKLESGIKIIEIRIKNEDDIARIISKNTIEEYFYKKEAVRFYSFDSEAKIRMVSYIYRYAENGGCQKGEIKRIPCNKSAFKLYQDSTLELNAVFKTNSGWVDSWHIAKWLQENKHRYACINCKYYHNNRCYLYKKFGTPEHPLSDFAQTCQYYRFPEVLHFNDDGLYVKEVGGAYKHFPDFKVAIVRDESFTDYCFFKKKCDYFLQYKLDNYNVILYDSTKETNDEFCFGYAESRGIENGNYFKYDGVKQYKEMNDLLPVVNAAIIFWDGNSEEIRSFIAKAKSRNIKVGIVDYTKE